MNLKGKTIFISGASRGIGLAIACAAPPTAPTSRSPPRRGAESEAARHDPQRRAGDRGGRRQGACRCRSTSARSSRSWRRRAHRRDFGGIDILVNNASAISLTTDRSDADEALRPDVRRQRARHLPVHAGLPAVPEAESGERGRNPHVLTLSPPLNMDARWFAPHVAYTMAKYGMSMCVLGHAEEFKPLRHRRQRAVAAHRDRRPRRCR
jgi:citronellol/citronellal dehydrogenase